MLFMFLQGHIIMIILEEEKVVITNQIHSLLNIVQNQLLKGLLVMQEIGVS